MNAIRWYCAKCKDHIIPVDGVTAIYSRGYFWCAKHATLTGNGTVDFPSNGMLVPSTILTRAIDNVGVDSQTRYSGAVESND